MRFLKKTRGVSLIELLVVLSIIAIVYHLSLPGLKPFFTEAASHAVLVQLQEALEFSREEALLRHITVVVCGSVDQKSCSDHWEKGFMVYMDIENKEQMVAETQMIRHFQVLYPRGALYWRAFPLHQRQIAFTPQGLTQHENGSFWYCLINSRQPSWALFLSQAGRMRVVYPNREGDILDERGHPLVC